jgi:hypothetical protein
VHLDNLQVWRDHDGEALRLGEFMHLDSLASPTASSSKDAGVLARTLLDSGGRLVVVAQVIDFDAVEVADTVRFFELLRELTSYGIAIEWRLRASHTDARWRDLWHLFPPTQVVAPAGTVGQTLEFWQREFHYGLCVMRRGPGLIEVRDRRSGRSRCLRFTSARHLEAIDRLEAGVPASSLEPELLAEFEAARVVMVIGDMRLWLPCRFRRSPLSPVAFW